jgi:hypothetical protein
MLMKHAILLLYIALLCLGGCQAQTMEDEFYSGDRRTENERLAKYTIEQQWQIYRYGEQKRHPPSGPVLPLAERGEPMMRYILQQLRTSQNDLDFRDSLQVFIIMEGHGDYRICDDAAVVMEVKRNQYKIKDTAWRNSYGMFLGYFCTEKSFYKQRQRLLRQQIPKL